MSATPNTSTRPPPVCIAVPVLFAVLAVASLAVPDFRGDTGPWFMLLFGAFSTASAGFIGWDLPGRALAAPAVACACAAAACVVFGSTVNTGRFLLLAAAAAFFGVLLRVAARAGRDA